MICFRLDRQQSLSSHHTNFSLSLANLGSADYGFDYDSESDSESESDSDSDSESGSDLDSYAHTQKNRQPTVD